MTAIHSTLRDKPNVFYRLWQRACYKAAKPATPPVVESPPLPTTCTVTDLKVTLVMRQSSGGGRRSSVYRAELPSVVRLSTGGTLTVGYCGPAIFGDALNSAKKSGWLKLGMAYIPMSEVQEIQTEELTRVVTIK